MLSLVPTPIGNLDDLGFRAAERLTKAEIFFCEDTRVTKKLLRLLGDRRGVRFRPDARFISLHSHNEKSVLESVDRALFDRACVYVSDAGMPCVSDPGALLIDYAIKNKIEYEVLPGANAALTAFAASGSASGEKYIFYGFLPHKAEARRSELTALLRYPFAIALYESPRRIAAFAALIAELAPDRRIAAFKEMTKLHEKRYIGAAIGFAKALETMSAKGEWTIILAPNKTPLSARNEALIDEVKNLKAPIKPLSKILAKLSGETSGAWYERLRQNANA
ncbi:MAG: 16S rRNA (cytidine(1402)-2'-O)-methyltransferase [Helicobacteraceae bacterium]|nr:16S rRNA (cytidine(1402)-2'-O)-methyltransferase [Helicobacteraceae bacterium]